MHTLLYVLAAVVTLAAGYLSFSNIQTHEEQLSQTNDLDSKNARLEATIKQKETDLKAERALVKEAQQALAETEADIDSQGSKIDAKKRSLAQLDRDLATQEEKLEEIKQLIAKIEDAFKGQQVPINKVPEFVARLNNEKKDLTKEYEELLSNIETMQSKLDKNNSEIADLDKRREDRAASLTSNGVSSLITAVNGDWGFVVIKPHPKAMINADSQLIIVRGERHLGRLNINAVEAGRVIADIDYDSLVSGARVRAGDRVILAKARTR